MDHAEYYKKAWEHSLSEQTHELQEIIKSLQSENARLREALEYIDSQYNGHAGDIAREALKGGE